MFLIHKDNSVYPPAGYLYFVPPCKYVLSLGLAPHLLKKPSRAVFLKDCSSTLFGFLSDFIRASTQFFVSKYSSRNHPRFNKFLNLFNKVLFAKEVNV